MRATNESEKLRGDMGARDQLDKDIRQMVRNSIIFNTEFIVFNTEFIIFITQSIFLIHNSSFLTEFIIFNTEFIIFNTEFANPPHLPPFCTRNFTASWAEVWVYFVYF